MGLTGLPLVVVSRECASAQLMAPGIAVVPMLINAAAPLALGQRRTSGFIYGARSM